MITLPRRLGYNCRFTLLVEGDRTMAVNWRGGVIRVWLLLSAVWLVVSVGAVNRLYLDRLEISKQIWGAVHTAVGFSDIAAATLIAITPPMVVLVLGYLGAWILRGFRHEA